MKITSPLEDRGVSPVVGVVLMVAITVILAGTVGMFITQNDMLDPDDTVPTGSFAADEDSDGDVTITYTRGEDIDADKLVVKVRSGDVDYDDDSTGTIDESTSDVSWNDITGSDTVTAGDSITLKNTDGEEIGLQWSSGGSSTLIMDYKSF